MPRGGAWPEVRRSEKPRWVRVSDASRRDGSEAEGRATSRAGEPRMRIISSHSAVQIRAPRVAPADLALTRTKPPCTTIRSGNQTGLPRCRIVCGAGGG